jgi:hypothetical protein
MRQNEEKNKEEIKLQIIKGEVYRAIRAIYIEPLASRPPPTFQESSESFGEERNVFRLCDVDVLPLWEKDLKRHCEAFGDIFHPLHL